jgi:creatinine amidohydrolase
VLPLGSTEQHAYLSLETDNILAERVAAEAAGPLGVPVLPALCYGVTPRFAAYPGSPSLSEETYVAVVSELVDSLRGQGFGRILVVNGHGGNAFAAEQVARPGVRWHDWWRGPQVWALVQELDTGASHASWMESFPWTRVAGVELPEGRKEPLAAGRAARVPGGGRRRLLRRPLSRLGGGRAACLADGCRGDAGAARRSLGMKIRPFGTVPLP